MSDRLQFDYRFADAAHVGDTHGISADALQALQPRADAAHDALVERRRAGTLPFYDLPYEQGQSREITAWVASMGREFKSYVHIGIGGSSLGPKAVLNALLHPFYNSLTVEARNGLPEIYFLENVDPDTVSGTLDMIDPSQTLFNIVTKSGSTAETAAIFLIVAGVLREAVGANWRKHIVFTTDPENGDLRALARAEDITAFAINPGVGGRFSVLTPVGLLPAALAGINTSELLEGAAAMDASCRESDLAANPAYRFAAYQYLANTQKGKSISIMMPYADRLYDAADWYCQLWGESLGKAVSLSGETVNVGQTPVKAIGAVDQHSQVQLYIEGPNDKIITFLRVAQFEREVTIPALFEGYKSYGYLGGKSLAGLMNAEQEATAESLAAHSRPNLTITFPHVTAATLGEFFYMLEVATAFSGGLYEIDPFDQPGVEHGKKLTYQKMGRG